MSLSTFPAPPGTYLIEREQGAADARKTPVVGFNHVQAGVVFPLCAISHGGLTRGRALVTADGYVTDPSYGIVCGSVEEWMLLTNNAAYWKGADKAATAPQEAASDHKSLDATSGSFETAPVSATYPQGIPAVAARIPDKPKGKPQEFINKTFWQHVGDHGDIDYIFVVEGGEPAPAKNAPGFLKIKRDDFQTEKKAGMTVVTDWQTGVIDEAPAAEDEDEPDGSNLI